MEYNEIKLRQLDLTLLLVFLGLLRHRKAKLVAENMGLTQSSISHSLKRLRHVFGDELFVRLPDGMEPTSVALELEPVIRRAVDALDEGLNSPIPFDPATFDGRLRLALRDHVQAMALPGLLGVVSKQAPGMKLSVSEFDRHQIQAQLLNRDVDLAVGFAPAFEGKIDCRELYMEDYSVVFRWGHDLSGGQLTLERYVRARHALVTQLADISGLVDDSLGELGMRRQVSISVSTFFAVLTIVQQTDLIATIPKRIALAFQNQFQFHIAAPPLDLRAFPVRMFTNRIDRKNGAVTWLARQLEALV